ncbi:BppU family phage baseplate upper protein [Bacillus sp. DX4.1]|uniref:BppU family phage baseplate upper protein n=1 Tax=Bacillus sp. DX4.1 TaxID=3055867 RepID=UPI0025A0716A|nr:BppU family phage baseplate upper protein [Bacillus sp. DX4.1]MDM5188621.1 BppU family phage baseplate upper protein [Bacillus sp. DX4.1]
MRNETIIIDLANPVSTKTIYSRQNDKSGLKVTVYLKEKGQAINLTGYVVKYEAANKDGNFIRDDAIVIDALKGVFEYTFSAEAVSTPNVWAAYFVWEKGTTERVSTQDLKVILGRDVKQGKIQVENYLSDFDKALEIVQGYQQEITATKQKIDELTTLINAKNVQIPKITKDDGSQTISVSDTSKNILDEILAKGAGMNTIYCAAAVQGTTPENIAWRGISYFTQTNIGFIMAKDYRGKFWTNYMNGVNGWIGWAEHVNSTQVVLKTGGNFTGDVTFDKPVKLPNDTDWTTITPLNGVTNQTGKTSKVKRTNNTVCLNMNVIGVKNNHIIATLPANFRPVSDLGFSATYILNDLNASNGIITIRADGSVHCEWIAEGTNPLKFWSFTLTYMI